MFLVWHLSIIIDGHASSDQLLGPMLVKVHCVSCLGLLSVSWVRWRCIGLLHCVCVAHDVCVVLRSSLVFFSFFLLYDDGKKGYNSYFITTGVTSFHVFLFCCRRLNTVLNVLSFFGIHSIGVACFVAAGTHHPAVVYGSIFQASSEWNASGHLGNLCLSCFDSSIKGISCETSRNGGNFSGSGPNKSLYFSAISSCN